MDDKKEQAINNPEHSIEAEKSTIEKNEIENDSPDLKNELSPSPRDLEARAEKARIEALKNAISVESGTIEKESTKKHSTPIRRGPINKKQLDKSYDQTMHHVQNELPKSSRSFSRIIHNKTVEKTSEVLGSTIARPNAILAGAIVAFILTLLTYTVAKTIGYALSGFETIAAFIIGWIIGIIYDYLRVLFTGKKY